MSRTTLLTLLTLTCLTALPTTAQARYRDGMSLYEYVSGSPLSHLDPSGEELCFSRNEQNKEKLMALVKILAPKAEEKQKGARCCIAVSEASNLSSRLVKEIADHNTIIWLASWGNDSGMFSREGNRINMAISGSHKQWFTNGPNGNVIERDSPADDRERATLLAHEMIHAYYMGIKNQTWLQKKNQRLIWRMPAGDNGTELWRVYVTRKNPKVVEEEIFATGLSIITKQDRKNQRVEVTQYDAEYTENKIRAELGVGWIKAAYGVVSEGIEDGPREFNDDVQFDRKTKRR